MRFSTLPRRALGACAVLCLSGAGALAAAPADPGLAPPIVGTVQDTTGAPLPNARVVIAEVNRSTTTGVEGTFVFRALRAGTYHLDVTLLGYAPGHAVVTLPEEGPEVRVTVRLRPTPLSIEGINVTASPASADPLRITQSTVELSGKALERRVGTTVAQTLSSEPGMSVRYAGPAASTPVIRGLSGERVLVLQNGQRTGDLSATSADHGLSVDPLAATRVEVVRGPASLLYGNNALGGVVNVITADIPTSVPSHAEGYVSAQGESVNPGGALSGEVTWPLGGWGARTVRGGGRRVDDVRVGGGGTLDNTFYRNAYAVAGAAYVGERARGGVSLGGYRFEYGLPAPPDAEEAGVSIEGDRIAGDGRFDLVLGDAGVTDLRLDGSAQWYGHDEVEAGGEVGSRFRLNTQTAGLTARTLFGRFSGAVGLSTLLKQYAPEGEEALTPAADSRNFGAFVYQELPLGGGEGPRLQAGARYDLYRIDSEGGGRFGPARTRDFDNLSASLGLSVPLGERISASVSAARSFRAPTVEELFSNAFHAAAGTFDVGNPELEVETNTGVEGVLRAQSEHVNAQLSAFYSRIDNYIFPFSDRDTTVAEDGEDVTVPLAVFRQADAALRGIEGQVEATLTPRIVLGAMGDVVRGDFVDGGPLPFMPAARLGASARWDDGRWSAGVEARHVFAQDRVPPGEGATGAYELVNLHAGYTLIRRGQVHSVTARVENLLDERYADASSRIKDFAFNPGLNLSLVYRLLF
ncbi:MAG TPA: TonB-dependent receptor [Longimicrobiaceae bacterium]|nr:TonB-dependent receptor [Longimicrobiaceae bacterium]